MKNFFGTLNSQKAAPSLAESSITQDLSEQELKSITGGRGHENNPWDRSCGQGHKHHGHKHHGHKQGHRDFWGHCNFWDHRSSCGKHDNDCDD